MLDKENDILTRGVTDREIEHTLRLLNSDKAPGPDGFPASFFKAYWPIIRKEVCDGIRSFFQSGQMPISWKSTFLALIPKVPNPQSPAQFRPISLCNTLYKIVVKIMVNRLKPLLPKLIAQEQGAFVEGRSILENVLLAQELLHSIERASVANGGMVVKVDMERAYYDRLRWDYLVEVLWKYGFSEKWIKWTRGCVEDTHFSVLVNGSPTNWFSSKVGLRQGCPLSPYLFILCFDSLSRALKNAAEEGYIEGIRCGPGCPPVTHLLYAEDCLLTVRATKTNCLNLKQIVYEYCVQSGQAVNFCKSMLRFSPAVNRRRQANMASILGISINKGTWIYLGTPISGRRLRASDFGFHVEKINRRLAGWKSSSLSMAGRLVLAQSVLAMIPVYWLGCTAMHRSLLAYVERCIR